MANLHQKDKRSGVANPTIISFASPSVTPSNNYKQTKDVVKEANSSLIMGRRIDSPKLRVQNDDQDRSASSIIQMMNLKPNMGNMKRDELFGPPQQYHHQQSMLNQTNKEIQQKQLDYSNHHTKANVTISYDTNHPAPTKVQILAQKSHKANKPSQTTQKKRPQSMGPKHMATASMTNNNHNNNNNTSYIHAGNQPLINVHVKNSSLGKGQQQSQNQAKKPDLKFAQGSSQMVSKGQHGKHRKNKSEGKLHHNRGLQKQFNIVNYTSIINNPGVVSGGGFVFDNKENQSVNLTDLRQLSPSKFQHPHQDQSISSLSSTSHGIQAINHMNKAYFMDKGTLLKHLSPERSQSKGKTQNMLAQKEKNDNFREVKEAMQLRSNGSTIVHQEPKPLKIKRPNTTNMGNMSKVQIKGVNKLIKDNLRRNKNKEDQELNKQVLEENKQKLKKIELSQRNQEVRKINASKIIMNHHHHFHKNSLINQSVVNKSQYKKKRSKSCMNKTDNIFSGMNKIKERIMNMNEQDKKEKKREKSFVLEMKELKRQIDDEIKRDIQAGRIDLSNGPVQRSNLSTINAKKETKTKKDGGANVSMIENKSSKFNKKQEGSFVQFKAKKKSRSKEKNMNAKLMQFIEKQKKSQMARKSLEQTIENEKHLKIKENLHNLNNFVKNHFRHQSQNIFLKKSQNIQLSNIQGTSNKENIPKKKLKPQFLINKNPNKNEQILDSLKKEMMYDKLNQLRDQLEELSNTSPERQIEIIEQARDNDTSNDFYGEYQKLIESIQKQQKPQSKTRKNRQRSCDSTNSRQQSPAKKQPKQKSVAKVHQQKQLKMKVKVPTVRHNEQEFKNEGAMALYQIDSSPEQQSQMTVIKRDATSIIADDFEEIKQSSVISISNNINAIHAQQQKNAQQKAVNRQSKTPSNNVSPTKIEYQRKVDNLVAKYGNKKHNDKTKLLIRLHSAAIMVQSYFRKFLSKKGFYDNEIESQMYIDSEMEGDFSYRFAKDSTVKKSNQNALKSDKKVDELDHQASDNKKRNSAKLYGDDASDTEKIIVCSVISSVRQEEEGDNSQSQRHNQQQQQQLQRHQVAKQQIQTSAIMSLAGKQQNQNVYTKEPKVAQTVKRDDSNQSLSSSLKNKVPALDLNKITLQQNVKQQEPDIIEAEKQQSSIDNNSSRHLFDRNSFREFSNKIHQEDFNMNMYPEMIKIREDAIKYREQTEGKYISKMYKSKQFSPRTYEQKRKELEVWVTKEKEDVKKTKKVFEEQWQKTTAIIQQTQKNQDHMKKMLVDSGRQQQQPGSARQQAQRQQNYNSYAPESLLSSYRMGSSRRESKLIDMINDNQTAEQSLRDQLEKDLQAQIQQQKAIQQRELEIQQRLDQQKRDDEERKRAEEKKQEELKLKIELQRVEDEKRRLQDEKDAQLQRQKDILREQELENKRREEKEKELTDIRLAQQKKLLEAEEQKKRQEELDQQRKIEEQQQKAKAEDERKKREEVEAEVQRQAKLKQEQEAAAEKENKRLEQEAELRRQQQQLEIEQEAEKQRQQRGKFQQEQEEMQAKFGRQDQNPPFYLNSESIHSQESDLKGLKYKQANRYDSKKREEDDIEEEELKSEPDMGHLNSDMDIDQYQEDRENQIIQDILDETNKNKQSIVDSHLDEKDKFTLSSRNDHKEEEPVRGLSRTRSSQYLKDSRDSEMSERTNSGDKNDIIKQQFEAITDLKEGPLSPLHKENFFTKNFDDERQDDLLDKMKNTTTDLKSMLLKEEEMVQKMEKLDSRKIYVEDNEEVKLDDVDLGMSEEFEIKKQQRVPADMLAKIPVEDEERFYPGMPVSPTGIDAGTDIRIQTGSQSLESTLSDDKKFKQLIQDTAAAQSASDKDDLVDEITDDIFKYLISELKVELDLLLLKDPRRMLKEEEQIPQNYFLSESGRFLIFERKGIKTDLFAIEKYVEEVLDETMKDKNKFLANINQALSKKSLEVLNQLQNSEIGSYEHFEVNFPAVLPLDLYLRLEKRRKESRERDNQAALAAIQEASQNDNNSPSQQQQNNLNFLAECEHIHNKVLFDCINDSLLQFKPYGKDGSPLPWSRASRRLKPIEDFTVEEMFEIVKHDLFRWAIMQAGTLPRREFVFGGVFDDELFAEIREKKLATLLAREMIENEPKWLNYEFEEAQVKIDIGDMILEQLVTESITILNGRM